MLPTLPPSKHRLGHVLDRIDAHVLDEDQRARACLSSAIREQRARSKKR
jgi:hypothetical protein